MALATCLRAAFCSSRILRSCGPSRNALLPVPWHLSQLSRATSIWKVVPTPGMLIRQILGRFPSDSNSYKILSCFMPGVSRRRRVYVKLIPQGESHGLDGMARFKLPSVEEFVEDPSKFQHLPMPMLQEMLSRMKAVLAMTPGGAGESIPDSPIEMAIENPKFRWMDAAHLHYLGERIAEAVNRSKDEGASDALVVTMPPRHAKSHLCSVWTPFWHLTRYPEDHVLLVSYESTIAEGWGEKV